MRRVRRRRGGCIEWLRKNSGENVNFEQKNFREAPGCSICCCSGIKEWKDFNLLLTTRSPASLQQAYLHQSKRQRRFVRTQPRSNRRAAILKCTRRS